MNDTTPIHETEIEASQYRHAGLPLTQGIMRDLIVELFSGRSEERREILRVVMKVHTDRGGLPGRSVMISTLENALGILKKAGYAENFGHGFWRIHGAPNPELAIVQEEPEPEINDKFVPEIAMGAGDTSVYVYFFRTYQSVATANGKTTWPCKIGMSDGDVTSRIYSQGVTAMPELPVLGLIFKTPFASKWERLIHAMLTLRGLRLEDSPGAEWFITSPADIVEIIKYVDPSQRIAEFSEPIPFKAHD